MPPPPLPHRSRTDGSRACASGRSARCRSRSSGSSPGRWGSGASGSRLQAAADDGLGPGETAGFSVRSHGRRAGRSASSREQRRPAVGRRRERVAAGEQLEEDDAERVHVRTRVDRRRAAGNARRCSGAMYGRVPPKLPRCRPRAASAARLKSSSIGWPSSVSRTLAGFRSRCRMPRSWAWARPSARRAPIQRTASDVSRTRRAARRPTAVPAAVLRPGRSGRTRRRVIASASGSSAPRERVGEVLRRTPARPSAVEARSHVGERRRPGTACTRLERPGPVDGVDRDDVRVLEPGERLATRQPDVGPRLSARPAGRPGPLAGEVDPAERPAAQLGDQPEAQEVLPRLREVRLALATRGRADGRAELPVGDRPAEPPGRPGRTCPRRTGGRTRRGCGSLAGLRRSRYSSNARARR